MKIEIVNVTPAIAKEWLGRNSKNRPIRKQHVINLAQAFARGEYVMTHQGVAFGSDGELIDGQHRLSAIASLGEERSFPMLVTRDLDRQTAFKVIDTGAAVRNMGDVLCIDRRIAECATMFARLMFGRSSGVTPTVAQPMAQFIYPEAVELLDFCPTPAKTWSSVPVRCAAIYMMKTAEREYVKHIYRAMVLARFDEMPPVAQALFRNALSGTTAARQSYDLMARCIKVFNPECAHLTKLQINNQATLIGDVREFLVREVQKKKAPELALGAKGVSVLDSSRRAA